MSARFRFAVTPIAIAPLPPMLLASLLWWGTGNQAVAHEGAEGHSHHGATAADRAKGDGSSSGAMMTTRDSARILPPPKSEDVFHFVIYGDRTGGVPAGLKVLEQAVEDTNLLDPDLVMTVGDLIQGYNETPEWLDQMREYKAIADRLNMKWYPVAGNHDVYWRGEGVAPEGQHEANYEQHFGPLWYSFEHKNAGFIALYSDEGNPETNEKAFNVPELQNMSEDQLAFLDKALQQLSHVDHIFIFLHHPRWIGGGYEGSNWPLVHRKLADAGNVTAVFAGHIHRMRYDGLRDGIEYFTLATTGGSLSADLPGAGYLHHLNMVSVRKDGISVSAIPIGGVIDPKDFTPEFLAEVNDARRVRPDQISPAVTLDREGAADAEVTIAITNPCPRGMDITLMTDPASIAGRWLTTLDHQHFPLAGGETKEVTFAIRRTPGSMGGASVPHLKMQVEYLAESSRVRLPAASFPIRIRPASVPPEYFAEAQPHCLSVGTPESAISVDAADVSLPDGPFTLEAWVNPKDVSGYRGLIAKTESSEYALFSDEGVPEFSVHLNGRYQVVTGVEPMRPDRWTHIAGVFDSRQVLLFVNGQEVGRVAATGKRTTNHFPLWIGADPDRNGRPSRPFSGKIDEVRLSKTAIYSEPFEPIARLSPNKHTVLLLHLDRTMGPFVLDHGGTAGKAMLGSQSELVPRVPIDSPSLTAPKPPSAEPTSPMPSP